MDEPIYPYHRSLDVLTFDFESIGSKGVSRKKVVYSQLEETSELYNLSLFEVMIDGTLDIYVESKNQDLPRIMATVINTMFEFFRQYPTCKVIFTGSTPERTRLYRIVIGKLFEKNKDDIEIEGITENGMFEPFEMNQNYIAYVIAPKRHYL